MTKSEREIELRGMRWQQLKAIGESMNPPIDKPEGGWDEAVDLILNAEYPVEESIEESAEEPVEESLDPEKPLYPIEFFKASGIPYCETCGAPEQRDLEGQRICPVSNPSCPSLGD